MQRPGCPPAPLFKERIYAKASGTKRSRARPTRYSASLRRCVEHLAAGRETHFGRYAADGA